MYATIHGRYWQYSKSRPLSCCLMCFVSVSRRLSSCAISGEVVVLVNSVICSCLVTCLYMSENICFMTARLLVRCRTAKTVWQNKKKRLFSQALHHPLTNQSLTTEHLWCTHSEHSSIIQDVRIMQGYLHSDFDCRKHEATRLYKWLREIRFSVLGVATLVSWFIIQVAKWWCFVGCEL